MIYNKRTDKGFDIKLRPFTTEDMKDPDYLAAFYDPVVTAHNSHGLFPYTKTKQEEFARELENFTTRIVWAIVSSHRVRWETKYLTLIGNCSLQSIDWVNRSAEFAIVIWNAAYWGKGVGLASLNGILGHAFNRLGLNRVWTGTSETNEGMQKVAIKAGMKEEGRFRQAMFLGGKFADVVCYGILENDFRSPC